MVEYNIEGRRKVEFALRQLNDDLQDSVSKFDGIMATYGDFYMNPSYKDKALKTIQSAHKLYDATPIRSPDEKRIRVAVETLRKMQRSGCKKGETLNPKTGRCVKK